MRYPAGTDIKLILRHAPRIRGSHSHPSKNREGWSNLGVFGGNERVGQPQPQKVRDRGKPNGAVLPWNFIARKLDRTGTGTQTNPQPNTSLGCFSASRPKQEFPRGARVVD